jgi:hypothetical protein
VRDSASPCFIVFSGQRPIVGRIRPKDSSVDNENLESPNLIVIYVGIITHVVIVGLRLDAHSVDNDNPESPIQIVIPYGVIAHVVIVGSTSRTRQ